MTQTAKDLPDAEVIGLLANKRGDFPQSLINQYQRKRSLSPQQWLWAHKLAQEVLDARAEAPAADMTALFKVLEGAEIRLARFLLGKEEIKLKRNAAGTSYYALMGDGHLGSVLNNGQFRPGAGLRGSGVSKAQLIEGLEAFGADPVGMSIKYGLATGTCGICGRRLTDPESVALGIGPICMERIGG